MAKKDPDAPLTLSEQWAIDVADPLTMDVITQRLSDGESLKEICRSRGWPKSFVWKWINNDPELKNAYDGALQAWADQMAQEAIQISDDADPETGVPHAKLRVDTRLKIAAKWDRQRYGETPNVQINAQSGSLVAILSSLPALRAPEEDAPLSAIDVTPVRVQQEKVIPMELREADEKAKAEEKAKPFEGLI